MGRDYLGEFELVVMLGLVRLESEAYGMAIFEEIQNVTGRELSIPAVYVTLNRLEGKGYVTSRTGEANDERRGRAKKYYRLTRRGAAALDASRNMLTLLWQNLPMKLEPSK